MSQEEINASAQYLEKLLKVDTEKIQKLDELCQSEKEERASDAMVFYKQALEPILEAMKQDQLENIAKRANTTEKLMFGRGVIAGLLMIEEWFRLQEGIVNEKRNPGEKNVTDPFANL